MVVTIVIPVFREARNLPILFDAIENVVAKFSEFEWRYIFVNDGSPDNSLSVLAEMASNCSRIGVIDLSRNFGKEIALTAGVHAAKESDAVICMDADLQHPPELIPQLIAKWREGYDVVASIRVSTEEKSLIRHIGSKVYYWLMSKISGVEMKSQSTDFRLFDQKVVLAFCQITERERLFRGVMDWLGFRKTYIEFKAGARLHGEVGYSLAKLWQLAINSITSFSLFPLRLTGYLGLLISLASSLLLAWMLFATTFINSQMFRPLAFFAVFNTLLTGVVLMAIGLLGLYIGNIHIEVTNRPLYVIREQINLMNQD